MKKLVCLFLIFSTVFSFVGCSFINEQISSSSINGVSLRDYSIVYSDEDLDYSKRAAEYIQTQIKERAGITIDLVEDSAEPVTEYEIVVGNTDRDISDRLDAKTEGLQFAMLCEEKQIALEGDYFIIAAAAYFFIETYVPEANYKATIPEGESIHSPIVKEAKNYIVLIGDGMGFNQTKMFEYLKNNIDYSDGEDIFYGYYLPYQGQSKTNSVSGVTDSAAGGTAIACGYKTVNGNIGLDKNEKVIKSLTELAYEKGMSAGVMSTERKTGATPASFSAHAVDRNESAEIIASQAEARDYYGTIIDCGYDYYTKNYMTVIERHITDTLTKLEENENGFFLMYEEAHIDKHCHNNELDKVFQAVVRFNQAIGRFMEYAFYNPDTFILITADHETGDLYANAQGVLEFHSGDHTGKNVPIFAYGDGAELCEGVAIENIQIAHTIGHFMGDDNFGDQSKFSYLGKE